MQFNSFEFMYFLESGYGKKKSWFGIPQEQMIFCILVILTMILN